MWKITILYSVIYEIYLFRLYAPTMVKLHVSMINCGMILEQREDKIKWNMFASKHLKDNFWCLKQSIQTWPSILIFSCNWFILK